MKLSDISIKNPVFAWMLMAGLILFGLIGFKQMGISQLPDVDFPFVTVTVTWEGASPEVMETEVTDVIEDAVMQVQGVKEVSSASRQGSAQVSIEFELGRDIDAALQEVQTKISQAQQNLPKNIDPPIYLKTNPEDQPIMWVALSGSRPLTDIMRYAKDHLKDDFTTVPGVGDVIFGGYVEPNLRVWLDADKMQSRELTVDDVMNAIRDQHAEVPAGYIDTGKQEYNVRVMGEASSVPDFEKIIIPGRAGQPLWRRFTIKDIAQIEDGLADIRRISRVNGEAAIGLGIKKQRGSNAVSVARAVRTKVAEIQKRLPEGMKLGINFDATKFIEDSVHELNFNLILAAVLTSIVCWLFLGSFSSALNIILAIPVSILGTFIFLSFLGYTLNTFTLLGLTLVIGIVVDDAIMVLENIVRHREMGASRVKASITGAREITSAAIAATIAILAIFIPVVFMKGIVGAFFLQYGVTISVAVALSLLEALTLAPMRTSQFLSVGHNNVVSRSMDKVMSASTKWYERVLTWCLNHRWIVVGLATFVFFASMFLVKFIKKEFVPPQDQSNMFIQIKTPIGTSIQTTDQVFREAEKFVSSRGEVERYYAAIGGFGGGEVNTGIMFVTLKLPKNRPPDPESKKVLSQQQLMPVFRNNLSKLPGIEKVFIQDLSLSGFASQRGFPVEFTLLGADFDKMGELSQVMIDRMVKSGYMVDADSDYLLGQPEVRVIPDRDKAAARGVNIATIGNTINAMVGGVRIGKYSKEGRRYDIRLRLINEDRKTPQDISKIWVRNIHGEVIRLSEVVKLNEKKTLLSITRKNRERAINIFSNVVPGKSQDEALNKVQEIAKDVLPEGYRIKFSGSAQTFKESGIILIVALLLGIIVAYMVLASQYNSFIHPIVVLLALPFSFTGAFLALWMGRASLNLYSMIGLLLLMGIVKKNSILLVDFTNERRKYGLSVKDALLEACPIRLRPIIMTSISTVVAALPPALALGPGAESRIPMALVIIGGVSVSTFLTLFVVPCAYSLMSRLENHKHDRDLKEALRELGEISSEEK